MQGYVHYLTLGERNLVWLYGSQIPNWLEKLPLNPALHTRSLSLFADPKLGVQIVGKDDSHAVTALPWDWTKVMSSPEHAILEALDELPGQESFQNLDMVFESLTVLRPKALSSLLRSCRKIKVKRLFSCSPTAMILSGANASIRKHSTLAAATALWSGMGRFTHTIGSWCRKIS